MQGSEENISDGSDGCIVFDGFPLRPPIFSRDWFRSFFKEIPHKPMTTFISRNYNFTSMHIGYGARLYFIDGAKVLVNNMVIEGVDTYRERGGRYYWVDDGLRAKGVLSCGDI